MKAIGFIILAILGSRIGLAQQMAKDSFGLKNGLPSNWVYKVIEDRNGFLWIATDAGVARYDGKQYQVYTKKDGLPDIEVLLLTKEKNGRIWIHCQNNSLAFYDEAKNKFVDVTAMVRSLNLKGKLRLLTPASGGISIICESGTVFFNDAAFSFYPYLPSLPNAPVLRINDDGTQVRFSLNQASQNTSKLTFYLTTKQEILDQRNTMFPTKDKTYFIDEDKLYLFQKNSRAYYVFSNFSKRLSTIQVNHEKSLNEFYMNTFSNDCMNMMHRMKDPIMGKDIMEVNVYDKRTYHYQFTIHDQFIAFDMYRDKKNNFWVSTIDKGLIKYNKEKSAGSYLPIQESGIAFYGLATDEKGRLYMGNERGEIIEKEEGILRKHSVKAKSKTEWQRSIISSHQKIFTFSDGGIFVNYKKELVDEKSGRPMDSKTTFRLNDSIVLSGSENNFCKLNTITEKVNVMNNHGQSTNAMTSIDGNEIIIGTHNGLFSYFLNNQQHIPYRLEANEMSNERISTLLATSDSLLWVGTATSGLVIVKDHQIIANITEETGLRTNNILSLCSGLKNQVWVGTNQGISKINYEFAKGHFQFKCQNISIIDGLTSNTIHQLLHKKDTLFAATTHGISYIPDSIGVPEISMFLTRVKINSKDTILAQQYQLKANQKNILLQFSGVDLDAYYSHAEYSFDEGKQWTRMEGNTLSLEFESGEHPIWVRAVDVNNHRSQSILKIQISIATPFWKTWWFWVLTTILIQALIAYRIYQIHKRKEAEKRKIELAKAHLASLEQQAFTSLMNPHFMFNALNSIQHFINAQDRQNANRFLSDFASLIRKNFEAAQQAFVPLEKEIENTNLYFRLEKMRFNDRFTYEIIVDENLDPEDWMMPTMILQPLVENALLHGIMPSKIAGKASIHFVLSDGDLLIEIIDNGIGIENSRALKQGSTHRSRGMELIHKRLHALSFFCKNELKLVYSIPFNDQSNPGNKISLLIPEALFYAWKKAQKNMKETIAKN